MGRIATIANATARGLHTIAGWFIPLTQKGLLVTDGALCDVRHFVMVLCETPRRPSSLRAIRDGEFFG